MTPEADPDRFATLGDGPEIEVSVKGSRFLGQAWHAPDEAAAMIRLESIRRRYHDATHHCWAFRLLRDPASFERWSDGGEPSGSAGVPILGALKRGDLQDAVVIVTRYFGGIKLGTGGLARAYSEAAGQAVAAAPAYVRHRVASLEITCGYDDLGAVEAVLARSAGMIRGVSRDFAPEPKFLLKVLRSRSDAIASAVVEATAGRATVRPAPDPGPAGPGGSSWACRPGGSS
jgi:uncharacterized YigZ family protein